MKSLFPFLLAILFAIVPSSLMTASDQDKQIPVEIPLTVVNNHNGPIFHAPSLSIPILCSYDSFTGYVYVSFLNSLGSVFVSIENPVSGASSLWTIPSDSGTQLIPVTEFDSHLVILLTLTSGTSYIGEFNS